jgi:hypothetical protein
MGAGFNGMTLSVTARILRDGLIDTIESDEAQSVVGIAPDEEAADEKDRLVAEDFLVINLILADGSFDEVAMPFWQIFSVGWQAIDF